MTPSELPLMYRVRQQLVTEAVEDVPVALEQALARQGLAARVHPGMRVAITAGSRGIDRIETVLRALAGWVRRLGARPFLVPAMGSHGTGGPGRAEAVLAGLNITPESTGMAIASDNGAVEIGSVRGLSVYCSPTALGADGIIVVNRVKPHTSFSGRYESGLAKMLAVGLGGEPGAAALHRMGPSRIPEILPEMARLILSRAPVILGIALVENGLDRLYRIEPIPAERILEQEPALLEQAKGLCPRLPFEEADVLVVDRFGKDLSGTGMDTRVIGRLSISGVPEPDTPRIRRIVALRLSARSHGNAYGIGLADVTTQAVLRAMDAEATRANALASTFLERIRIPVAMPSDREAIRVAAATSSAPDPGDLRVARIRDTRHIECLHVSGQLLHRLTSPVDVIAGPEAWGFDSHGNLSV